MVSLPKTCPEPAEEPHRTAKRPHPLGNQQTAPPYRWLVEVSGDAQARPGALTAADSDRTAAVEAENAGLRRELATLGEALRFARDQAERSAVTVEQLTRALPAPPHGAIAARPWHLRGRRCRTPLSHGRRAGNAPPRLRAQA